jgi:hypothetical protein
LSVFISTISCNIRVSSIRMELFSRSGGVIRSILPILLLFYPALEQEPVLPFYSCTMYSSSSAAILLFYGINYHFGQAFQCVVLKFFLVQFPAQDSAIKELKLLLITWWPASGKGKRQF